MQVEPRRRTRTHAAQYARVDRGALSRTRANAQRAAGERDAEIEREMPAAEPHPHRAAEQPLVIDLDQPGRAFDAGWVGADARIAARRG